MWFQQKQSVTDGGTDEQQTRWYLCGTLLSWRHKKCEDFFLLKTRKFHTCARHRLTVAYTCTVFVFLILDVNECQVILNACLHGELCTNTNGSTPTPQPPQYVDMSVPYNSDFRCEWVPGDTECLSTWRVVYQYKRFLHVSVSTGAGWTELCRW